MKMMMMMMASNKTIVLWIQCMQIFEICANASAYWRQFSKREGVQPSAFDWEWASKDLAPSDYGAHSFTEHFDTIAHTHTYIFPARHTALREE